jgi:hypothetical protein
MPHFKKAQLLKAVEDINSLYEKPVMKLTADNSEEEFVNAIVKFGDKLEDGDALFKETIELLLDLEIDIPAKLKVRKPEKATKVVKEKIITEKESPPSKIKAVQESGAVSTKLLVYREWKKGTALDKICASNSAVKGTTIRSWINSWKKNKFLPRGA